MAEHNVCIKEERIRGVEINVAVLQSEVTKVKSDIGFIKDDIKDIKKMLNKYLWWFVTGVGGIIAQIIINVVDK